MPPPNKRSMITSVKYHVQQWINLVLYNSIYQNLILLYLYRTFKFIFGYLDQSTELSRICGATHYPTPLDSLWDELGNPTSSLLNDKQGGTIAYTNALTPATLAGNGNTLGGGARRGTIHVGTNSNRNSTESVHSSLSQESGQCSNDSILSTGTTISSSATVVEKGELNEALSEIHTGSGNTHQLKHRKKRRESSGSSTSSISSRSSHSSSTATAPIMDLRQSKAAAEMVYRIDRCILFSKQLTAERRELEGAECDPVQITQQILRKKKFPESGSPNT
ncbi:hypothetical protein BGZ50_009312 [Haplosporangium sp. Z 11]|nr:hypothetical protein BGZ50_009312 [Haplosporangium sp. Z 11]